MDWTKETYNTQYEKWVPWLEDVFLRWFTKDNKASYSTKRPSHIQSILSSSFLTLLQKISTRPKSLASSKLTPSRMACTT